MLNIAMLGAAKIGEWGLVDPANAIDGITLYSLAARDRATALAYAVKHNIPAVHDSYESLIADPKIDAIYNPLPNALHCDWTIKALDAGKHVLCEKPFASNGEEARLMAEAALRNDRVLMEALHYRFHPMAKKMQDAVKQLGTVSRIETFMCVPLYDKQDIRYDYKLGGGAGMDVGAYAVSLLRYLAAAANNDLTAQPKIESTKVLLRSKNIDRAMKIEVRWDDGTTGLIHFSLWSSKILKMSAHVVGEKGSLKVRNPYLPHFTNKFELRVGSTVEKEKVQGETTYTYQLEEFKKRIEKGSPYDSDLSDTIATMDFIDAIYDASKLPRRGLTLSE